MMLGIDFGTSNTAAAIVQADGRLHPIALDGGNTAMPTALFFASEDGRTEYGARAMQAYLQGAEGRLMRSIKSLLGSRLIDEQTVVNGRLVSFFDIVVMFFTELKARAQTWLGHEIDAAMLGRPVHFVDDDPRRDALAQATLERAARAAGFTHIEFQLEPIAAAFDFEKRVTRDTTALVVDIGGGTSDFTVIELGPDHQQQRERTGDVLATTGIHLGGTDFDRLLDLAFVMPLLGRGHVGPNGREVPSGIFFDLSTWHLIHHAYSRKSLHHARELRDFYADTTLHRRLLGVLEHRHGHRLLAQVEAAKIDCSSHDAPAAMDLDCIEPALVAQLTPEGMRQALAQQVGQIVACAQQCVNESGARHIDAVYLTGGSSAFAPLVSALQDAFTESTIVKGDRFGGVAAGLAYSGALRKTAN
jgi:hypothetical chaperone protein